MDEIFTKEEICMLNYVTSELIEWMNILGLDDETMPYRVKQIEKLNDKLYELVLRQN